MGYHRDTFKIRESSWLREFEITSANYDATTSGRDWVQAGFKGGYEQGFIAAVEAFGIWKDGKQKIGCLERTVSEEISRFLSEIEKT